MTPIQHDDEFISAAEVEGAKRAVVGGQTQGVSPKPIATAAVGLVVWLLAHYGVNIDADLEAIVSTVAGLVAGVAAPPGTVQEK